MVGNFFSLRSPNVNQKIDSCCEICIMVLLEFTTGSLNEGVTQYDGNGFTIFIIL